MSVFTTLTAAVSATATTISVADDNDFPLAQFRIAINGEEMLVTGGFGTLTWTVTRDEQATTEPVLVAEDKFDRVGVDSWGVNADGIAWQNAYSETNRTFSVNVTNATIEDGIGGVAPSTAAPRLSIVDGPLSTELMYAFILDTLPVGASVRLEARPREHSTSTRDHYVARMFIEADADMTIRLLRRVTGADTNIGSLVTKTALFLPNVWYWVRVQAIGDGTTTTLNGKLWKESDGEPVGWDVTGTDTNATMQTPGYAAMRYDTQTGATGLPYVLGIRDWQYLRVASGGAHANGDRVELVDNPDAWPTPAIASGYGPPQSAPSTGSTYVETGTGKLWVRVGAEWKSVTLT